MCKVIFSDDHELDVESGTELAQVFKDMGWIMDFPCGGNGKCGQCKVKVAFVPGWQAEDMQEVLACSYIVDKDLWVQASGRPGDVGTAILTRGSQSSYNLNPGLTRQYIPERDVTIIGFQDRQISVNKGNTTEQCWGLAVDIGTTTVVGYLVNLFTGEQTSVGAELNRQRVYGADVISRITYAQNAPENLRELQSLVIDTINDIIKTLIKKSNIKPEQIYLATMAGNTCMHHLLLGLNPITLGRAPFLPVIQHEVMVSAKELGVQINPNAVIWVFPVVAGFVGGDTVAAVLATDFQNLPGIRLLVDIGTNGELVLNLNGRLTSCSAAAGPALEGAQVSCGMRADAGAISRVSLVPEIKIETIGDSPPKGICGSGLIDLVGELIKVKAVNLKGGLIKPEKYNGPEYIRQRIIKGERGCSFQLLAAEENNGQAIIFSQEDLQQIQLAKGALNAAAELLVKEAGITGEQVEEILLAGAFGNFLDKEQSLQIGLFPAWARNKITYIGNAAGQGAKTALLALEKRAEAAEIGAHMKFLEFAGTGDFQTAFINGLLFKNA